MPAVTLTSEDLQAILTFIRGLAHRAGALILEGSEAILASGDVNLKKNEVDLVTEYDVRVEELVKGELGKEYEGFKFIGEESYAAGSREPLTDEPTFCVDPIDGTTNFVHGFPHVCISIGLIYLKSPVLGVIYNPFLDQLYYATKGHGAFLEQRGLPAVRLPLSKPRPLPSLAKAIIGAEWGSDRSAKIIGAKAESYRKLAGNPSEGVAGGRMAHALRSIGSAALNYALVAQGGLDMYWEIGCWPWDICAGSIIAQEAGGLVTGAKGTPVDNIVDETLLDSRKYFVVRAIADTETESGRDAQKRIVKEFYETVEDWTPM